MLIILNNILYKIRSLYKYGIYLWHKRIDFMNLLLSCTFKFMKHSVLPFVRREILFLSHSYSLSLLYLKHDLPIGIYNECFIIHFFQ